MIKNDLQLAGAQSRLSSIEDEIQILRRDHFDNPPPHLVFQLEREKRRLEEQIDEYLHLRELSLEQAVNELRQRPVLLENVGELLAKLRIAAGFTQKQLADQLGWEQSNLSRFESANYSSQTIAKISEYLDGLGVWLHVAPSVSQQPNRTLFMSGTYASEATGTEFARQLLSSYLVSIEEPPKPSSQFAFWKGGLSEAPMKIGKGWVLGSFDTPAERFSDPTTEAHLEIDHVGT